MAVIRHGPAPEDHYSMVSNELARDPNISLQAKGIYLYLRSHREGWAMSTERIGDGRVGMEPIMTAVANSAQIFNCVFAALRP